MRSATSSRWCSSATGCCAPRPTPRSSGRPRRRAATMLAAVSHDLRSPLAAIKASVTDLLDPEVERSTAERAAVLHVVDSEADRLDALVANLLDLSRIEAGVRAGAPRARRSRGDRHGRGRRGGAALARRAHRHGDRRRARGRGRRPGLLPPGGVEPAGQRGAVGGGRRRRPSVEIEIGPTDHGQRRAQVAVKVVDHGAGLDARRSAPSCSCPSPGSTSGRRSSAPASGSRSRRGSSI